MICNFQMLHLHKEHNGIQDTFNALSKFLKISKDFSVQLAPTWLSTFPDLIFSFPFIISPVDLYLNYHQPFTFHNYQARDSLLVFLNHQTVVIFRSVTVSSWYSVAVYSKIPQRKSVWFNITHPYNIPLFCDHIAFFNQPSLIGKFNDEPVSLTIQWKVGIIGLMADSFIYVFLFFQIISICTSLKRN